MDWIDRVVSMGGPFVKYLYHLAIASLSIILAAYIISLMERGWNMWRKWRK